MVEYISRDELLKHLNECKNDPLFDPDMARICFAISIFVKNMKTTDVQSVKNGKWVEHINHRYDYDREQGDLTAGVSYTCSLCDKYGVKGWRFCPSCGARMDGEQNGR